MKAKYNSIFEQNTGISSQRLVEMKYNNCFLIITIVITITTSCQSDKEKLVGTWVLVSYEVNGEEFISKKGMKDFFGEDRPILFNKEGYIIGDDKKTGVWKIDDESLEIKLSSFQEAEEKTFNYYLTDKELILKGFIYHDHKRHYLQLSYIRKN